MIPPFPDDLKPFLDDAFAGNEVALLALADRLQVRGAGAIAAVLGHLLVFTRPDAGCPLLDDFLNSRQWAAGASGRVQSAFLRLACPGDNSTNHRPITEEIRVRRQHLLEIATAKDLVRFGAFDYLAMSNFGMTTLYQLMAALREIGLTLPGGHTALPPPATTPAATPPGSTPSPLAG